MEIICFDMDHTLLRSNRVHIQAFNKAFREHGLKCPPSPEIKKLFGMQGTKMVKVLFPEISKEKAKSIVDSHNLAVIKHTSKYVKAIRGAKGTLKLLRKYYLLALISNASHDEITSLLKHANIDKNLFSVIIAADDIKQSKPDPDAIIKAMKITKTKSGYMVGDSIWDIQAGKNAKVKTIAVLTGNQDKKMLKKEKPDYIISSVAELPKIILK